MTDFQPNGSLYALLRSSKEISWETVLRVLEGVSAGMYHIHREHILHRDLAARNVLLSASMDPMVADFGLSAKTKEGTQQETYFKGALKYMAPESLSQNLFSTKSDVWSFGVMVTRHKVIYVIYCAPFLTRFCSLARRGSCSRARRRLPAWTSTRRPRRSNAA